MVNQERNNGKENIVNTKKCQFVDFRTVSSFCEWKSEEESDTELEEEQLQSKTNPEEIPCNLETEEEPHSCDENGEIVYAQLSKFEEMNDNDIQHLYSQNYLSGNSGIDLTDILNLSCETNMFKSKYNLTYQESQTSCIQEYEIILKSNNVNNNSKDEKCIYVFRNRGDIFFWHNNFNYYKNLNQKLTPNNINIINWLHRINYFRSASDQNIQKIYPGYNHTTFIYLFYDYLNMSDDLLKAKMDMSKYDLLTLYLERAWLNDQVINKYFTLIKIRNNKIEEKSIHVYDTFFWTRFNDHGYNQVKNDTKRIDIFSFKKLLIPINISQHWVLVGVDVLVKKVFYYDSIELSKKMLIQKILKEVMNYLELEHSTKKGVPLNTDEWCYFDGNSPVQYNNYDCGVFTCINGELFSKDEPSNSFDYTHINLYRQKIVSELLGK